MEKLVEMSLWAENWEEYEETADHILWLFQKCSPMIENKFFPKKEVKDVQLPEDKKL